MRRTLVGLAVLVGMFAAPAMAAMTLSSADLKPGATISSAQIYPRCGGENISPQLSWSGAPAGTKSFVLTMIDTSVKPAQWSHWVVVDIPATATSLARGVRTLPGEARQISSNFGDPSYDGPCPPGGSGMHRYEITLWALATPKFSVVADLKATDLEESLAKVSLARASLTGVVSR
jgi:Raf kinase inhibitor-like YbhB/YbcL family protein